MEASPPESSCVPWIERLGPTDTRTLDILKCFRNIDGDVADPTTLLADSEDLVSHAKETILPSLPEEIVSVLSKEIDLDQSQLFSRRFSSVVTLLESQDSAALLAGLIFRTREILTTKRSPKALRIRAVADFYYTQAAITHHKKNSSNSVKSYEHLIEEGSQWRAIADSRLQHKLVTGFSDVGPINVNVLKVGDLKSSRIRAVNTQAAYGITSLEKIPCLASVSGGFFLYSEENIEYPSARFDPVGLLVTDGKVVSPPR